MRGYDNIKKICLMPKKSLSAIIIIVDRAVWGKATKGRAGIRWGSLVEKEWKDAARNQEKEILSIDR